jgi:transcriptional regulator with XRE-family HTH domain
MILNAVHKKAKIRLIELGLTFRDLCKATGLKQTTVSNTLSGRTAHFLTRQIITNFCGVELWPGVFVTEREFTIPPGTEFECLSLSDARDKVDELAPGSITRKGRIITFIEPVTFIFKIEPEESQSAKTRKISASSTK